MTKRRLGRALAAALALTQPSLPFERELVVDLFAGAGGASLGLAEAYREPDVAVNHDPVAIAVHRINHPTTEHYTCDVFEVDPVEATKGRPVGVLWASPDCRHHSKAAGRQPRSKRVRGLAWVVVRWAAACKPRLIHLENVEEFADWGPLLANGQPCQIRKGMTYRRWVRQLENLGYTVEARELVAADHDTPTTRKRLYVVARCDGQPIVWPAPTNSKDGRVLPPWRAAAECIDFSLPACSIFADKDEARAWGKAHGKHTPKRPLERTSKRRVAKGLWRYTLAHPSPFIAPLRGSASDHCGTHGIDEPATTVSAGGTHHALVAPTLIEAAHADESPTGVRRWGDGTKDIGAPIGTIHAGGGNFALGAAHMVKFRFDSPGTDANLPLPTITAGGAMKRDAGAAHALGLATAHLTKFRSKSVGAGADEPHPTITSGANSGVVMAYLAPFGQNAAGTDPRDPAQTAVAGAARYGLVTAHLTEFANTSTQRTFAIDEPLRTQVAQVKGGHFALASAHLEQANGGYNAENSGHDARRPLSTATASGAQQRLVTAYFVKSYSNGGQWSACDQPLGAATTKDRMGLVEVFHVPADIIDAALLPRARQVAAFLHEYLPEQFPTPADIVLMGDYVLADITLRMLTPRELARAQGFPDSYVIEWGLFDDPEHPGQYVRKPITKTQQVRLIGNSVCRKVARDIAAANLASVLAMYREQEQATA